MSNHIASIKESKQNIIPHYCHTLFLASLFETGPVHSPLKKALSLLQTLIQQHTRVEEDAAAASTDPSQYVKVEEESTDDNINSSSSSSIRNSTSNSNENLPVVINADSDESVAGTESPSKRSKGRLLSAWFDLFMVAIETVSRQTTRYDQDLQFLEHLLTPVMLDQFGEQSPQYVKYLWALGKAYAQLLPILVKEKAKEEEERRSQLEAYSRDRISEDTTATPTTPSPTPDTTSTSTPTLDTPSTSITPSEQQEQLQVSEDDSQHTNSLEEYIQKATSYLQQAFTFRAELDTYVQPTKLELAHDMISLYTSLDSILPQSNSSQNSTATDAFSPNSDGEDALYVELDHSRMQKIIFLLDTVTRSVAASARHRAKHSHPKLGKNGSDLVVNKQEGSIDILRDIMDKSHR